MAKSTAVRSRLGVDAPMVREYLIVDAQDYTDKDGTLKTVCKYVKPRKSGRKTDDGKDIWEDVIMKEFVVNSLQENLLGRSIKITTEIV